MPSVDVPWLPGLVYDGKAPVSDEGEDPKVTKPLRLERKRPQKLEKAMAVEGWEISEEAKGPTPRTLGGLDCRNELGNASQEPNSPASVRAPPLENRLMSEAPKPPMEPRPWIRSPSRSNSTGKLERIGFVPSALQQPPPLLPTQQAATLYISEGGVSTPGGGCEDSRDSIIHSEIRDELRTIHRKLDDLAKTFRNGHGARHKGSYARSNTETSFPDFLEKRKRTMSLSESRRTSIDTTHKIEPEVVKALYKQRSMLTPMSSGLEMVLSGGPHEAVPTPAPPSRFANVAVNWAKKITKSASLADLYGSEKPTDEEENNEGRGDDHVTQTASSNTVAVAAAATAEDVEEIASEDNPELFLKRWRTLNDDDFAKANTLLGRGRNSAISSWRRRSWNFVENPESSTWARYFATANTCFIICATLVTITQAVEGSPVRGAPAAMVEASIDMIFLLELILRFFCCPSKSVWFVSIYTWIDVFAAAPLIVRAASGWVLPDTHEVQNLPHGILLCAVPILRLLKTLRRFESFHLLIKAFSLAAEALPVLLYILTVIAMVFAVLIYLVEPRDNIHSLPHSFWLSIVTMTTVGYGDVTPKSSAGSCIIGVLVVITVLYMAIPLGIIGNAFTDTWQDRDRILLMQRTRDRLCQWGYSAHDIPVLFRITDSNQDGELDIKEFRKLLNQMQVGFSEERILKLFQSFDHDSSGTVDDREFVQALFPEAFHQIYTND